MTTLVYLDVRNLRSRAASLPRGPVPRSGYAGIAPAALGWFALMWSAQRRPAALGPCWPAAPAARRAPGPRSRSAKMPWLPDLWDILVDEPGRALSTDQERSLVSRCLSGDAGAFDELVSSFGGMVFNLAYRQLGDREEALDLSQEIFLRIHRKLDSFRGDSSLKTWIFRIVLNMAYNRQKFWKVRHRSRTVSLDAPLDPTGEHEASPASERIADARQDPERDVRNQDLKRLVEEGLAELSFEHRRILVLRDIEELSYEEIGGLLELNEGTVKSRISRARSALKEILAARMRGDSLSPPLMP